MTDYESDFTGGQTYSEGRASSGYEGDRAFDNNSSTQWYTGLGDYVGTWVQVELGAAKKARKLRIQPFNNAGDHPTDFTLKASNTGSFGGEEVTLVNETSLSWSSDTWKDFEFANSTQYTYYRIHVSASPATNGRVQMREVEMMEADEIVPSMSQSIAVTEIIQADIGLRELVDSESIGITENIQVDLFFPFLYPSGGDDIGVDEDITVELEEIIEATTSDLTVISESLSVVLHHNAELNQPIGLAENIRIALDIPTDWIALANAGLAIERYCFT
ncbi:MAG: discoidin domain-containing protein, partial [candidate division Zixibacteria bacterium]|nr:discoidin domain-containing protein [candidate division Zixibacteria bacterium]